MTIRFQKAIQHVLAHEGGYNNIADDAGGATNYGVSLVFLRTAKKDLNGDGKIDTLDVKNMTKAQAEDIYWNNFWKPYYDVMTERLAMKLFDTAVNTGHARANILLQRSLLRLGSKVNIDGVIGQQTLNECKRYAEEQLLVAYVQEQLAFYRSLVTRKPSQQKFLKGWENRANWLPL
jgi:lysozyme family protein